MQIKKLPVKTYQTESNVLRWRPKNIIDILGFICLIFWGVGTQLEESGLETYWYIAKGIGWGEILFPIILFLVLIDNVWLARFESALSNMTRFVQALVLLALILTLSVAFNTPIYGGDFLDMLACMRIIYFSLIAVFVNAYVQRNGVLLAIFPFVIGLLLVGIDQLIYAHTSTEAVLLLGGLPMAKDPNVIGAIFGYGVLFCSLAILQGGGFIYGALAVFFAFGSLFTFSKGAWLMVALSGIACFLALKSGKDAVNINRHRVLKRYFIVGMLTLTIGYFAYNNYETLESVFQHKLETTADNESVNDRFNLALVGLYAMVQNPILGVGYRNYDAIGNQYPELIVPDSGNANNAIIQIGAIGGVPSFILMLWIFWYPLSILFRLAALERITWLHALLVSTVMFIFAVIQTQLIAQPVYWVFSGIISGWCSTVFICNHTNRVNTQNQNQN